MESSVKTSVINSLAYIKELCEGATPDSWQNAALAAITVVDSTIETVIDNC